MRFGFVCALVVCIVMIALGIYLDGKSFITYRIGKASRQWDRVPATVTRSEIGFSGSRHGGKYLNLEYIYSVDGHRYTGHRIGRGDGWDVDSAVEEWPVGKELMVFVNPERPSEAVVLSGYSFDVVEIVFLAIVNAVMLLAVAYLCWLILRFRTIWG